MKKIFLLFLGLLLSGALHAQEGLKVGISFGPAFVGAKSELSGVSSADLKSSGLGYRLGLLGLYGLSDNFGLYAGAALVGKATKKDDAKTRLTTLELPIGLRLRSGEIGSGLYVGALIGPTIDLNLAAKSIVGDLEVDAKDNYRTFASTMRIGFMAEKTLGFGTLAVIPSYNIGLTDVSKGSGDALDIRYRYFDLSVAIFF
jgi:hypothetical protein